MKIKVKRLLLSFILLIAVSTGIFGQKIAVKSNLLYDASASVNIGAEFGLNDKWTLDVSANYNPFTFSDNKKWKHWFVQPEARRWFDKEFDGHFVGLHLLGGEYNVGGVHLPINILGGNFEKEYRYDGWFIGGGIVYGYSWKLSPRWNIEGAVALGYIGSRYDKYECPDCGSWLSDGFENYLGPTKLSVSIIYVIK